MISISYANSVIDDKPLIDLSIINQYEIDYNKIIITFNGSENIVATTDGRVEKNKVIIDKKTKNINIFLSPIFKSDIELSVCLYNNDKELLNKSFLIINSIHEEELYGPSIVFTGKGKTSVFDEKIKGKIENIGAAIEEKNGAIVVNVVGNKKIFLACFGLLGKILTNKDLVFYLDEYLKQFIIPKELVFDRFNKETVALHVLVKPDYQKKVKNIFYKSQISNVLKLNIPELKKRSIKEFSDPLNVFLDPLEWIINEETQLPVKL